MSMYPIASISGAGAARTFTNIPQTFTHLQLRMYVRDTSALASVYGFLRFNGVAASGNYIDHYMLGNGATTSAGTTGTTGFLVIGFCPGSTATASSYGVFIVDIFDYTNTNKNKTVKTINGFDNNGSGTVAEVSGLFLSTSAITSIQCGAAQASDDVASRIDLYGISTSNATGA